MGQEEKSNGVSKLEPEQEQLNALLHERLFFPEDPDLSNLFPSITFYGPSKQEGDHTYTAKLLHSSGLSAKRPIAGISMNFSYFVLAAHLLTDSCRREQIIATRDGRSGLLNIHFPNIDLLKETGLSEIAFFDHKVKEIKVIVLNKLTEDEAKNPDLLNDVSMPQEDPRIILHYNDGTWLQFGNDLSGSKADISGFSINNLTI